MGSSGHGQSIHISKDVFRAVNETLDQISTNHGRVVQMKDHLTMLVLDDEISISNWQTFTKPK